MECSKTQRSYLPLHVAGAHIENPQNYDYLFRLSTAHIMQPFSELLAQAKYRCNKQSFPTSSVAYFQVERKQKKIFMKAA